ncbi:hypothetical protein Q428_10560 [Fervidicella metallireducens AeB]|uniref:Lipoprotein n=1 Tax=Fervidicella metallireducens AeB TaxID=1403537 RepID=A0A017RU43_9CLOT|nr:hypothetical protein [Fervidicella metallireducens]EYE87949.1 hypothetical protein Q428_10560 [Fervidicella metallireducens AeB]
MKRLLSCILLVFMLVQFSGCGNKNLKENSEKNLKTQTSTLKNKSKDNENSKSSIQKQENDEVDKIGDETKALIEDIDNIIDSLDEAESVDKN